MSKTLDEWVNDNAAFLRENLKANIEVLARELDEDSKQALFRCHLFMVRDWASMMGFKTRN